MRSDRVLQHAAMGAAAGILGTFVISSLMAAQKKLAPQTMPPMRGDPGEFMVKQTERMLPETVRRSIPDVAESVAAKSLSFLYGATFGAIYGALRSQHESALLDGPILGLLTWAAGYLGWLPATGLMPAPWKQETKRIALPVIEHALYGLATVAAFDLMHHAAHESANELT